LISIISCNTKQDDIQTGSAPPQPTIQWVPGSLSLGVKWPRREAYHSPPSSAEVKECVELYLNSPIRFHGVVLSWTQGQLYLTKKEFSKNWGGGGGDLKLYVRQSGWVGFRITFISKYWLKDIIFLEITGQELCLYWIRIIKGEATDDWTEVCYHNR
jgi:hypothetical protein